VCSLATKSDPLWIANINSADQIVLGGTRAALDTLRRHAPAAGARDLKILDVTVASHGPLQAGTARAVADALGQVQHGDQRRAYFANTSGRRLAHATEKVIDDLAQAVQQPVRRLDAASLMPELGVTTAIQTPPGHVLAAITAHETPGVTSIAVDDTGWERATTRRACRDRNVTHFSTRFRRLESRAEGGYSWLERTPRQLMLVRIWPRWSAPRRRRSTRPLRQCPATFGPHGGRGPPERCSGGPMF